MSVGKARLVGEGVARGWGEHERSVVASDAPMTAPAARPVGWGIGLLVLVVLTGAALKETAVAAMTIFSAVRGRVIDRGVPVAGAIVEREYRWAWKDETGTDRAATDADGHFTLPAIQRSLLFGSLLPHEPVVRQTILIRHGNRTFKAWMFDKGNYDVNGELDGRPIVLTCRLESDPRRHGDIYGICDIG